MYELFLHSLSHRRVHARVRAPRGGRRRKLDEDEKKKKKKKSGAFFRNDAE